jgi:uncharacterized protein (DUF2235 family)
MAKNIVICCDGTSNEIKDNLSNVLKLFRILKKNKEQLVFYDPGIGTLDSSDSWSRLRNLWRVTFGLVTGAGLDANILAAYEFLIDNYEAGDQIYLFGFSRGAYTVRVLAGFVHIIGLLEKPQKNLSSYALVAYKQAAEKSDFEIAWRFQRVAHARSIKIRFVGVWDTVSSVIAPKLTRLAIPRLLALPYTRKNPIVCTFRHARAVDERRRMFRLNRWEEPQTFQQNPFDREKDIPQDIKQVWFCGDHSDVGGGYPENQSGLAKFPLAWMVAEAISHGLLVDTAMYNHLVLGQSRKDEKRSYVQPDASAELHNSMTPGWKVLEWIPKSERLREWKERKAIFGYYLPRGEPRVISEGDMVHQSVFDRVAAQQDYKPTNLPEKSKLTIVP